MHRCEGYFENLGVLGDLALGRAVLADRQGRVQLVNLFHFHTIYSGRVLPYPPHPTLCCTRRTGPSLTLRWAAQAIYSQGDQQPYMCVPGVAHPSGPMLRPWHAILAADGPRCGSGA